MRSFLSNHAGKCYAIMRIVAGLLFACHGAQKLFGVLGAQSEIHDPEGLVAGVVEFGGGMLRLAYLLGSRRSSPAARWQWPISKHMQVVAFGRSLVTANWPSCTVLFFSTSSSAAVVTGVSIPCARDARDRSNQSMKPTQPLGLRLGRNRSLCLK